MSDVHVLPIADLKEHEETRACWCHPRLDVGVFDACVVVHHALDGREYGEPDHEPMETVQ